MAGEDMLCRHKGDKGECLAPDCNCPPRKTPRVPRTFRLPPDLIERYEVRAAKLGMDRTAFVERAIEAALGTPVADDGPVVAAARAVAAPKPWPPPKELNPPVNRADAFRGALRRPRP